MRRLVLILLLMLLTAVPSSAEKLCAEFGPANDMFCAINGDSGPNWFVFTGCEDIMTIEPPDTEHIIESLSASHSGRYMAILSSGEGHPVLGLYLTDKLDYGETPEVERIFNPYPGHLMFQRWEKETLFFESNYPFDLDKRHPVPAQLSANFSFAYDTQTGELIRLP